MARRLRLAASPRIFKERHVQLKVAAGDAGATPAAAFPALGWNWAERVRAAGLGAGSLIDLAYRLRENEHPDFGGIELEIADLAPVERTDASPQAP